MAKAGKTASKNNPTNRKMAAVVMFNGKQVVPCKFIGTNQKGMAAAYKEDMSLVMDDQNQPVWWSDVQE